MVRTRTKTYASVAPAARTSTRNLLEEAAEVGASFNDTNEAVFAAEGELPQGSAPAADQNALSVYSPPRIRRSDLEEYLEWFQGQSNEDKDRDGGSSFDSPLGSSINSPQAGSVSSPAEGLSICSPRVGSASSPMDGSSCLPSKVEEDDLEGAFTWPKVTAKKKHEWSAPLDMKNRFFPTWFDLSIAEDQLGPIPEEWEVESDSQVLQEEHDLGEAIRRSLSEHAEQISSMAVLVEVEEEPVQATTTGKGKNVTAGERSAAFAQYLQVLEREKAATSKSKASQPVDKSSK